MLKLVWRLHTSKDSLWIAWLKLMKLNNDCYWTYKVKQSDSWIWRTLLNLRPLVKLFLRSNIGSGLHTNFWHDRWLKDKVLADIFDERTQLRSGIKSNSTVAEAAVSVSTRHRLNYCRDPSLKDLWHLLMAENAFALTTNDDTWSWSRELETKRTFSTHYTWTSPLPPECEPRWFKLVWFKGHVPRLAFTSWLFMQNKLPTKDRLYQWQVAQDPLCIFCDHSIETHEHLFLSCNFSEEVWRHVMSRLCGTQCSFADLSSLTSWLLASTRHTPKLLKRVAAQVTLNHIWRARNEKLFSQAATTPSVLFKMIDRTVRDTLLARKDKKKFKDLLQRWFAWH